MRQPNVAMEAFRIGLLRHPWLFGLWRFALTLFGRLTVFWRKPQVTAAQIAWCKQHLVPGDIIGVESRRFCTGWVLPKGRFGVEHSAIYIGGGQVVEAVTPVCRYVALEEFLRPYDRVIVAKPCPPYDRHAACRQAIASVGKPYDVLFDDGEMALYCHETCALVLIAGGVKLSRESWCYVFDDLAKSCHSLVEVPNEPSPQ